MNNGYVYIIKKEEGFIKVGRSTKPNIRIRQIETQGGFISDDFFISQKCSNYREIEINMHKLLSRYRKMGEWFEFDFNKAVEALKMQKYLRPLTQDEIKEEIQKQVDT